MAAIVGKIIAFELATTYIPRLCCYRYFTWVAKTVTRADKWHKPVQFPKKMIEDFKKAISYVRELSGIIRRKKHVYKELHPKYPPRKYAEYAGDGNELYGAYFSVQDPFKYRIIQYEGYDVKEVSSSFKELLVLYRCIKDNVTKNRGNDLVYYTDSRVLFFWHSYGSSSAAIADILRQIKYACVKNDIILEISWKPREDSRIQLADTSCKSSTDEFAIPKNMYNTICDMFKFQPEIDLFASTLLHRTDVFYSSSPALGSSGANALNFPWNRKSFCHPPKSLMHEVFKKLEKERTIDMVLVFLKTSHNTDLTRFLDKSGHFKSYIKNIIAFDSRVHSPGNNPTKFLLANHSWYALRIVKDNNYCQLKQIDIYHLR